MGLGVAALGSDGLFEEGEEPAAKGEGANCGSHYGAQLVKVAVVLVLRLGDR